MKNKLGVTPAVARAPAREEIGSNLVAGDQLRGIVERIERLREERESIARDIADVFSEAKANGFDAKALRVVLTLRAKDPIERQEHEAIVALYRAALGMD